ncbi:unnamed protein product [Periconia digitata]|uniref:Uncharacterized protein n=1 Tax=Periconia digitata TaxID=1303443 RepID=A0A9W4UGR4_9PLEO|nr:unnamed protein product [Periconia digitata]
MSLYYFWRNALFSPIEIEYTTTSPEKTIPKRIIGMKITINDHGDSGYRPLPTPTTRFQSDIPSPSQISPDPAQSLLIAESQSRRIQKDLIILCSFPDNTTLTWRPTWFPPLPPNNTTGLWTLHNPPQVVTDALPRVTGQVYSLMTRRMRKNGDRAAAYIQNESDWQRYCEVNGVPTSFLNEQMIAFMRLGLEKDGNDAPKAPPAWPRYPEPQLYRYILPGSSIKNLPRKFRCVDPEYPPDGERIVVYPDGALEVCWAKDVEKGVPMLPIGKHWSYVPWTAQQEESSQPRVLRLHL